jgi:hypothetical protein
MKKLVIINLAIVIILSLSPECLAALTYKGTVFTAQDKSDLFYINPVSQTKYCLNSAYDTFQVMRGMGQGINHRLLQIYTKNTFPSYLSGKIMLDVQNKGQAYYVDPKNQKGISLGKPEQAWKKMADKGIQIPKNELNRIKFNPQQCNYNPDEKIFKRSYDVVWSGKIIGNMNGFQDFGIQRLQKNAKYPFFYATLDWPGSRIQNDAIVDGHVRIYGKMIGITCAYQNTVFKGECVPEIDITKIEKLK